MDPDSSLERADAVRRRALAALRVPAALLFAAMLGGCPLDPFLAHDDDDDGSFTTSSNYYDEPTYLGYNELRGAVRVSGPRPLERIGRPYLYQDYLFLNAPNEGVHVIDNRDPSNPVAEGFIEIPGNTELAIRDGILYADSYVDLVAIDIDDSILPQEVSRQLDIFPWDAYQNVPEDTRFDDFDLDRERGVVIGHGGGTGVAGTGGSTARMAIARDYLYAIAEDDVQLLDISTPSSPNPFTRVRLANDIETLFHYGDYLLVGAANGVYIIDNTDPGQPERLTEFTHARARDPLVAENGYAYVTLREDGIGGGLRDNQLDVIDITTIDEPRLVDTLPMQSPSGLSVDTGRLYVCDGRAGLKIYDTATPAEPMLIGTIPDLRCNDVIANSGRLYAITADALIQYDLSTDEPLRLGTIGIDDPKLAGGAFERR